MDDNGMRIALDAMGTDARPVSDVAGGIMAAQETGDTILLIGDEQKIRPELAKHDVKALSIEVIHAPEEILMSDKPANVMKSKPASSMHLGMQLVRDKQADAFVTMGNTGAAHAIATLSVLRRIPGVKRPALTIPYPVSGQPVVFLDVGANVDARPEWLEQFAVMGGLYAEIALKIAKPRIATLSNGEEEGKGNQLVRDVQERLRHLNINYIGHIEPKELLRAKTDVVVFDGFVGNIFMKTFEGTISYLTDVIRHELMSNLISKVGAALTRNAFRRVRKRIDPDEFGGAALLGVNGIVIIGHGSGSPLAVRSAIMQARTAVQGNLIDHIRTRLEQMNLHSGDDDS
jgi:glycerol-3-phosphate acyltransferase PlsX